MLAIAVLPMFFGFSLVRSQDEVAECPGGFSGIFAAITEVNEACCPTGTTLGQDCTHMPVPLPIPPTALALAAPLLVLSDSVIVLAACAMHPDGVYSAKSMCD